MERQRPLREARPAFAIRARSPRQADRDRSQIHLGGCLSRRRRENLGRIAVARVAIPGRVGANLFEPNRARGKDGISVRAREARGFGCHQGRGKERRASRPGQCRHKVRFQPELEGLMGSFVERTRGSARLSRRRRLQLFPREELDPGQGRRKGRVHLAFDAVFPRREASLGRFWTLLKHRRVTSLSELYRDCRKRHTHRVLSRFFFSAEEVPRQHQGLWSKHQRRLLMHRPRPKQQCRKYQRYLP